MSYILKIALVLLSFLYLNSVFAQQNSDSLRAVWHDKTVSDDERLKALQKFIWADYLFVQPDSAFYYSKMQYDFAQKSDLKGHMANALNTMGASHFIRGNYDEAINYYQQCLVLKKELGDEVSAARTLGNIGNVYQEKGDYANAVKNYIKCLQIQEKHGDTATIALSLGNIGLVYNKLEEYDKAIEYLDRSLNLAIKNQDKINTAQGYVNLGGIYNKQNKIEKAREYYYKALDIYNEINDKRGLSGVYMNLALTYNTAKDHDKALELLIKAAEIQKKSGEQVGYGLSLNNMSDIYLQKGQFSKALEYATEAYEIAANTQDLELIRKSSLALYKTYSALNNNDKALEMLETYIDARDTLESRENEREVIRQQYKYEYEKQAIADSILAAEAKKRLDNELAIERLKRKENELMAEQNKLEAHQQKNQKYFIFAGLLLAVVFGLIIFGRLRLIQKQKVIIETQKQKVDIAYDELEVKNKEILDSISYAKRIQSAILPPMKIVKSYLKESFIIYKPKDIVAGDFYWMEYIDNKVLFAACDCTGHGVPGAMVSVICNNGLNRSVREHGLTDPGQVLSKTREIVIAEFEKSEEDVKDGMDVALCSLNETKEGVTSLKYAGANNPLWIIRNNSNKVEEIKADKQPIGKHDKAQPYTTQTIELKSGDTFYIFSDGFADQFGGDKGKKLKASNFKRLLLSVQQEKMDRQKQLIDQAFENWRGNLEQLDDVCVIGVRI